MNCCVGCQLARKVADCNWAELTLSLFFFLFVFFFSRFEVACGALGATGGVTQTVPTLCVTGAICVDLMRLRTVVR